MSYHLIVFFSSCKLRSLASLIESIHLCFLLSPFLLLSVFLPLLSLPPCLASMCPKCNCHSFIIFASWVGLGLIWSRTHLLYLFVYLVVRGNGITFFQHNISNELVFSPSAFPIIQLLHPYTVGRCNSVNDIGLHLQWYSLIFSNSFVAPKSQSSTDFSPAIYICFTFKPVWNIGWDTLAFDILWFLQGEISFGFFHNLSVLQRTNIREPYVVSFKMWYLKLCH